MSIKGTSKDKKNVIETIFRFSPVIGAVIGLLAAALFVMLYNVDPVSYTHLDVYKRQVLIAVEIAAFLILVPTFIVNYSILSLCISIGSGQRSRIPRGHT